VPLERSAVPLTTRRPARALVATALAAALAAAGVVPAMAAPTPEEPAGVVDPATDPATDPVVDPVAVSVIVPITTPPSATGLLSSDEIAAYTGPEGSLTRQLDAVAGTPAVIALDPMILASIRVLGSDAPETAMQWVARLAATSNEVFLLAYADADLVSAARTDTLDAIVPSGFGFALDPANFAGTAPATLLPEPSDEPTPDAPPPYPSTDDILDWETPLPRIAWPSTAVGRGDLAVIAGAGYDVVIVTSDAVGDPATPLVTIDGVTGMTGVVADAPLSSLLSDAVEGTTSMVRASALDALEAALASDAARTPGRHLVLTVERDWPSATPGLAEALERLEASEVVTSSTLADVLTLPPTTARLGDGAASALRDEAFVSLASDAAAELAFSSVLEDPSPLLDPRALERIALYSLGWERDESGWGAAVDAFHTRSDEIRSSVQLEQSSDVALLASAADLKVVVSNALPFPVTVQVTANPRNSLLRAELPPPLVIEPESTGTARVPVEAIANGEVLVLTSLTSPTGIALDSGHARVTVRAEWEGIGTLVVVIGLVLVFAAGIVRLIVVRRRARRDDRGAEGRDG